MSGSAGTGSPLHFFCPRCRRQAGWREGGRGRGWKVVRTGRTRPFKPGRLHARGIRSTNTSHEYVCSDCGHVGWSAHVDVAGKPLAIPDLIALVTSG